MRIVVCQVTRMQRGIGVAGIEPKSLRYYRPLFEWGTPLPLSTLREQGGPFGLGAEVEIGRPDRSFFLPPHVEDSIVSPEQVKFVRQVPAPKLLDLLRRTARRSLAAIYGSAVQPHDCTYDACVTEEGTGKVSLGCLDRPKVTGLRTTSRYGEPEVRLEFGDGRLRCDAKVNDLRFYQGGEAGMRRTVAAVRKRLAAKEALLLGVGLTASYQTGNRRLHWLQVTGLYFEGDPLQLAPPAGKR